jgi:hypothetical protein
MSVVLNVQIGQRAGSREEKLDRISPADWEQEIDGRLKRPAHH